MNQSRALYNSNTLESARKNMNTSKLQKAFESASNEMTELKKIVEDEIGKCCREKNQLKDLETELGVLIEEFTAQLNKDVIEKYACG